MYLSITFYCWPTLSGFAEFSKIARFVMGLLRMIRFWKFLHRASDAELADAYEERRLKWLANGQNGTGEKTYEMRCLDEEMYRRSSEKWNKNPSRSTDPDFRWTDANRWED